jgi:3-phenylpropionate/trans-cinnamate dioxygenase ferredoxin subunit
MPYVTVATTDELPPGSRLVVEVDSRLIAVFNVDNRYYAIEDECTHDGGPLADGELNGMAIECPRHGATFDIRTGQALTMPATQPTARFETRVADGEVQILV